ncbi:hypothetical protein BSKO_11218 [Bryopsis sp. KO-2023]|nr:hypothetical protein BSKO_11218 [Bryopsis sp. KO-2023]
MRTTNATALYGAVLIWTLLCRAHTAPDPKECSSTCRAKTSCATKARDSCNYPCLWDQSELDDLGLGNVVAERTVDAFCPSAVAYMESKYDEIGEELFVSDEFCGTVCTDELQTSCETVELYSLKGDANTTIVDFMVLNEMCNLSDACKECHEDPIEFAKEFRAISSSGTKAWLEKSICDQIDSRECWKESQHCTCEEGKGPNYQEPASDPPLAEPPLTNEHRDEYRHPMSCDGHCHNEHQMLEETCNQARSFDECFDLSHCRWGDFDRMTMLYQREIAPSQQNQVCEAATNILEALRRDSTSDAIVACKKSLSCDSRDEDFCALFHDDNSGPPGRKLLAKDVISMRRILGLIPQDTTAQWDDLKVAEFFQKAFECAMCESCVEGSDLFLEFQSIDHSIPIKDIRDACLLQEEEPANGECTSICSTPESCMNHPEECSCTSGMMLVFKVLTVPFLEQYLRGQSCSLGEVPPVCKDTCTPIDPHWECSVYNNEECVSSPTCVWEEDELNHTFCEFWADRPEGNNTAVMNDCFAQMSSKGRCRSRCDLLDSRECWKDAYCSCGDHEAFSYGAMPPETEPAQAPDASPFYNHTAPPTLQFIPMQTSVCESARTSELCHTISLNSETKCAWTERNPAERTHSVETAKTFASAVCPHLGGIIFRYPSKGMHHPFVDNPLNFCHQYCDTMCEEEMAGLDDFDLIIDTPFENQLICESCNECKQYPADFVRTVYGLAHPDHDTFVDECTRHLVQGNEMEGFCLEEHHSFLPGPSEACWDSCEQHEELRQCGDSETYDECHRQHHCRWSENSAMDREIAILARDAYCSKFTTLVYQVMKEGAKDMSSKCSTAWGCDKDDHQRVCGIVRGDGWNSTHLVMEDEHREGEKSHHLRRSLLSVQNLQGRESIAMKRRILGVSLQHDNSELEIAGLPVSEFVTASVSCDSCNQCHEGSDILKMVEYLATSSEGVEPEEWCHSVFEDHGGECESVCDLVPDSCNHFPESCSCRGPRFDEEFDKEWEEMHDMVEDKDVEETIEGPIEETIEEDLEELLDLRGPREECEDTCVDIKPHDERMCADAGKEQCLESPPCIWTPGDDDEGDEFSDMLKMHLSGEVCARATNFTTNLAKSGDVQILETEGVCGFICKGNTESECDQFLNGITEEDSQGFRRRLEEEGHSQPTILEFMMRQSMCSMCQDCKKNPQEFSSVLVPAAKSGPDAVMKACKHEFNKDGECKSRCAMIDPRECWKEPQFCTCGTKEGRALPPAGSMHLIDEDAGFLEPLYGADTSHQFAPSPGMWMDEDFRHGHRHRPSCDAFPGFDQCLQQKHCRWKEVDKVEAFLETQVFPKLELELCILYGDLVEKAGNHTLGKTSETGVEQMCMENFACTESDEEICMLVNNDEENEQSERIEETKGEENLGNRRRILRLVMDAVKEDGAGKTSVDLPVKLKRALLEMDVPEWMEMNFLEFFATLVKCDLCTQCKDPGFQNELSISSKYYDADAHRQSCASSSPGDPEKYKGTCENVCDSISHQNCHKYEDCHCGEDMVEKDDEGMENKEEGRKDFTEALPPIAKDGWVDEKEEKKDRPDVAEAPMPEDKEIHEEEEKEDEKEKEDRPDGNDEPKDRDPKDTCITWAQKFPLLQKAAASSPLGDVSEFCKAVALDGDVDECLESANILVGMVASGMNMQDLVDICIERGGTIRDYETELESVSHFVCDPTKQCCRKFSFWRKDEYNEFGLFPLPKDCIQDDACDFTPQCVLAEDHCLKDFDDLAICGKGCSLEKVADGKMVCIDKNQREMCGQDIHKGCKNPACAFKPKCTPKQSKDFSCPVGDSCCIPTTQEKFSDAEAEQCTTRDASCKVEGKCMQIHDPCAMFASPWECNQQGSCFFQSNPTGLDVLDGKCRAKEDSCSGVPPTECPFVRRGGRSVCKVVDRCEEDHCDPKDQCCGLDEWECNGTAGCTSEGQCTIKPGLDECLANRSEKECNSSATCSWDGAACWTRDETNVCMRYDESPLRCSKTSYKGMPYCQHTRKCLSECSICEECIAQMATLQTLPANATRSVLRETLVEECVATGTSWRHCGKLANGAMRSQSILQRPAAICRMMNKCKEGCTKSDTGEQLDLCTDTGFADGASGEDKEDTTSVQGSCMTPVDCGAAEYCSYRTVGKRCSCDTSTGFDVCDPVGQCTSKCQRYEKQIARFNSRVESCSSDADCAGGYTCDTSLAYRCRKASCNELTGVFTNEPCDGICTPGGRTMTTAKFDNYGSMITIELNYPAKSRMRFLCSSVFDADSMNLLGDRCFGTVIEKQMFLYLRNPTIVANDMIAFADDQTVVQDAYVRTSRFSSRDSNNDLVSIPVEGCGADCVKPVTVVVSPPVLSAGCGNGADTPSATLDGSYTMDLSGRPLECTWSVDPGTCRDGTSPCPVLGTKLEDVAVRSKQVLELSGAEIDEIAAAPGVYTITLTCSNFLGGSSSFSSSIEFLGTPVPAVSVVGPLERTFVLSKGLRISAYINPASVCSGDRVIYSWTQVVEEGEESWIPDGEVVKKDLRIAGPVPAVAQKTYEILLTARLQKPDLTFRDGTSTVTVSATAVGSEVSASLTGAGGDVIMANDLVLTAVCKDPDDPTNSISPFSYEYSCTKASVLENGEEFEEPCSETATITGSQVVLGKEVLTHNIWYTYSVTCRKYDEKPDNSLVERSATAMTRFKPRSADSPVPTAKVSQQCGALECPPKNDPNARLKFLLEDLKYADTQVLWSCSGVTLTDENAVSGLTSKALVIRGGTFDEAQTITCTATLSRVDETGEEHFGEAGIDIDINAIPFCTADTCVTASMSSQANAFPDAEYSVAVANFMDDEPDLQYSFGCMQDGTQRVYQKGTQTFFTLAALQVGSHECFACAVDQSNTQVCEYFDLEVAEPVGEISAAQQTAAVDAVKDAQASGDPVLVLMTVKSANNLLTYENGKRRRRMHRKLRSFWRRDLLDTTTTQENTYSMVQTIVEGIEDSVPLDFTLYQSSLDELGRMTPNFHYASAEHAMYGIRVGLDASTDVFTTTDVQNILTVASTYGGLSTDIPEDDILEAYSNSTTMLRDTATAFCLDSSPGDDPKKAMTSTNTTAILCAKEVPTGLNGKELNMAAVTIQMPSDFAEKCGELCTAEYQMDLFASYSEDSSIQSALVGTPVSDVGVSDVRWLSGVVDVQSVALNREALCADDDCWMIVTLPVTDYVPSKETVCLRIEDGNAVGTSGLDGVSMVENSYDAVTGTVQCNITRFGEVFVADYTSPPSPPPPFPPPPPSPPSPPTPPGVELESSSPPPPPPPPLAQETTSSPPPPPQAETTTYSPPPPPQAETTTYSPPPPPGATAKDVPAQTAKATEEKVVAELTFENMRFEDISGSSPQALELRQQLQTNLARQILNSNPDIKEVQVTGFKPGSVIATVEIIFDADKSANTKQYLADIIEAPEVMFDETFLETYGPVTSKLVEVPNNLKADGEDGGLSTVVIVIIVAAVVVVVLLVILGVMVMMRNKKYQRMPANASSNV